MRFLLFLVLALEFDKYSIFQGARFKPFPQFLNNRVGQQPFRHVGTNKSNTGSIDPPQDTRIGLGRARHKIPRRNATGLRRHTQPVQLINGSELFREPGDDINLFIAVIGAVIRNLQAIGDQFNKAAQNTDTGTKFRCLCPINLIFPLDSWDGPGIFDIS